MKRILTVVTALMLVALMAVSVCAADGITVTLNGEVVDCSQQPATIVEGRTLVPLRAIFEALGATVNWDQATKTVTSNLGSTSIELTIGADTMYVNGEAKALDVPGQIINSSTMVPARAIAEAYGVDVQWDAATRTVVLTKSNKAPAPEGAILYRVSGEDFASIEDAAWGGSNTGIQIVENPLKTGDKVFYIETNVSDKQSWNYFWYDCEFEPGTRYLATFSILSGTDCFGNIPTKPGVGVCYKYDNADHNVGSGVTARTDKWVNFATIGTIPETADASKGFKFGIYASPVQTDGYDYPLPWNLYFDNITVVPYEGDLDDGLQDASLFMDPTGAGLPANFDFDTAEGELLDLAAFTSAQGSYDADKGVFSFVLDKEKIDPLASIETSFDAAEYPAFAVKFAKGEVGEKANAMQVFFTTDSNADLSEDKSLRAAYIDCGLDADGNMIAYFAFAELQTADLWSGKVTKIRIDPGDDYGNWDILGAKILK